MSPERAARARAVFEQAVELEPGPRAEFLAHECAGDATLRSEVEVLLRADAGAAGFLERPVIASWPELDGRGMVGRRLGRYRVVRLLGAGGMGAVYEATQESPSRAVALKLMRPGLMDAGAVRRFGYESEALGRLRHPGIAQVYEAGTYRAEGDDGPGVPFFAMEFVPGARTLTDWAERTRLDARGRIELLARVCDAVHHGHQRGVIHRDLKPANILVDESGQPKIIDFGVARSTDADVTAVTMATGVGQLVGTLRYMSPEQCRADPRAIDTRTDVYSIGVVLYELLTGRSPYDLDGRSLPEATRIIVQTPPARPSTIRRTLRGDLETIVLKALEKDPERRYASAAGLAADLRRFLAHEPITARPPTTAYQLRMFARRNRALVSGVTVAFAALALGVVGTTIGLVRAVTASGAKSRALEMARESESRAKAESEKAQAVVAALTDMISTANPGIGRPPDYTVRRMLDDFAGGIDEKFKDQPGVRAEVHRVVGSAYQLLSEPGVAETHLRAAVDLQRSGAGDDEDFVLALADLGNLLHITGRLDEAEQLAREAVDRLRATRPVDDQSNVHALTSLATILTTRGDFDQAEAFAREAMEMQERIFGAADARTAESVNNLAVLYLNKNDAASAEPLLRRVVAAFRERDKDGSYHLAQGLSNLGAALDRLNRPDEAILLFREALEMQARVLPPDHIQNAITRNNLARALRTTGDLDGAIALYREAIALYRTYGTSPNLASGLHNLGRTLAMKQDYAAAEPLIREALAKARALFPESHPLVMGCRKSLEETLRALGREAEIDAPAGVPPPGK